MSSADGSNNVGHGHVYPRPDGVRARCGGPGICAECSGDFARQHASTLEDTVVAPIVRTVDVMHPHWREQMVGGLRAGELTFGDVAALLEDMASGGYPYQLHEDRVAVRIAIVARAAELLRAADKVSP